MIPIQYKIWIHAIWTTKESIHYFAKHYRKDVAKIIENVGLRNAINVYEISVQSEHVHTLLETNPSLAISEAIGLLKRLSANIINEKKIFPVNFSWSEGFYAFSVSDSRVEAQTNFLKRQDVFHETNTYNEEIEKLLKIHKI